MKCSELQKILNGEQGLIETPIKDVPGVTEHISECANCAEDVQRFESYKMLEDSYMSELKENSGLKNDVLNKIKEEPNKKLKAQNKSIFPLTKVLVAAMLLISITGVAFFMLQSENNKEYSLSANDISKIKYTPRNENAMQEAKIQVNSIDGARVEVPLTEESIQTEIIFDPTTKPIITSPKDSSDPNPFASIIPGSTKNGSDNLDRWSRYRFNGRLNDNKIGETSEIIGGISIEDEKRLKIIPQTQEQRKKIDDPKKPGNAYDRPGAFSQNESLREKYFKKYVAEREKKLAEVIAQKKANDDLKPKDNRKTPTPSADKEMSNITRSETSLEREQVMKLFKDGILQAESGDYQSSIDIMDKIIKRDPNNQYAKELKKKYFKQLMASREEKYRADFEEEFEKVILAVKESTVPRGSGGKPVVYPEYWDVINSRKIEREKSGNTKPMTKEEIAKVLREYSWNGLQKSENDPKDPEKPSSSSALKFQIATSSESTDTWKFVGPDGTDGSYYTTDGEKIPAPDNQKYIRYRVYLNGNGKHNVYETEIEYDPQQVEWIPVPGMKLPNGAKFADMFFESEGINPFVDTNEESSSTFAVDVDTASYTITRNYLGRGSLPPKEAIRVEEFINFFKHNYEAPKDKAFAAHLSGCPSNWGKGYQLLRVGIKGKEVSTKDRKSAALTFVIDVSGSMDMEYRLGAVKKSLEMLVGQMTENDSIGIVVYGTNARIVMDHKKVTDKDAIMTAINSLNPEGSTNAEAGLTEGYKLSSRNRIKGGINRVILCSDGVANNGVTEAGGILKKIEDYAAQGIFLTTVGFGMGNYNDVLMEKLADKGNGNYAYVDNLKEAKRIFVENLTSTLQVIAKDVKIQVEFNPKTVRKYRLLGYENRHIDNKDFRNDAVDAGEIGVGHEVTAIYELKLNENVDPVVGNNVATVRIRHKKPDADKATEIEQKFTLGEFAKSFDEASASLKLDACVAEFAEILRKSYWARGSSFQSVLNTLYKVKDSFDKREDVMELIDMVKKADELSKNQD